MAEPFLAEIKIVAFNFPPRGWSFCDGQTLPISQNQSLYSLLGTTYGGDGRTTFGLPDLRGRVPIHVGAGNGAEHTLGERGGEEAHTLVVSEMPNHTHQLKASSDNAANADPSGNLAARVADPLYGQPQNLQAAAAGIVPNVGANQGHQNMMPYLALYFVIALQGVFPSRN